MITLAVGQAVLAVYALLLAAGGAIGYAKAGSMPSLIAGFASAVVAVLALVLSFTNPTMGMGLTCALGLVLAGFFGYRFAARTRKFMPAGLLAVVSAVVMIIAAMVLL